MNILYLDPYSNTKISKQYLYYEGLYNSLLKTNNVYLFRDLVIDYNTIKRNIPFVPDLVIFGLSWFEKHKYFDKIRNLNIPSVCFLFKPDSNLEQKIEFCKINQINLILTPCQQVDIFSNLANIPAKLFPYGFDPVIFKPRNLEKEYDVGFSGALHAAKHYVDGAFTNPNIRVKIYNILLKFKDINLFWKSTDVFKTARIHNNIKYAETINIAKIWIATQAAFGDITPRYFEVMGSGSLLFCERNPMIYSKIFQNKKNCIEFKSSLNDFKNILEYYLNSSSLIKTICRQGVEDAHNYHTWDHRAVQLKKLVDNL